MTLLSLGGCFPFNRFKGWGLGDFSGEGSGEWGNGDQGAAFALQLALTGVGTALVLAAAALGAAGTALFPLVFEVVFALTSSSSVA